MAEGEERDIGTGRVSQERVRARGLDYMGLAAKWVCVKVRYIRV